MDNKRITPESANTHRNGIDENKVYTTPGKGIDSGAVGKASEAIIKSLLSAKGFITVAVSAQGKQDFICYRKDTDNKKHRVNVEIKTGRGEITSTLKKSDYVIYAIRPEKAATAEKYAQQFYCLHTADFLQLLSDIGLITSKRSTRGNVVECIQNFHQVDKKTGEKVLSKKGRMFVDGLAVYDIGYNNVRI